MSSQRKKYKPRIVGTDRPKCGGDHFWQKGEWDSKVALHIAVGAILVGKIFYGTGPIIRVTVDETPASGRFCRELRQGGSAMVPGFKPWSGRWIKIVPET